jgi:DNA-binding SARP family transcriptional activator
VAGGRPRAPTRACYHSAVDPTVDAAPGLAAPAGGARGPGRVGAVRVRVLGPLRVDGVAPTDLATRKGRTLLALLALARGRPVPVDRIVDVLWGDAPPRRPADQVAVLASRLRAVLGRERVPSGDAGYALVVDWFDLAELESRADEADARLAAGAHAAARLAVAAALALVHGPVLADHPDAPWCEPERAAAARLLSRVRATGARAALAAGDPVAACDLAATATVDDPYDEDAVRLLMQGHLAAGRTGAALAAYAALRARLVEELGADPDPATEALHTAILRGSAVTGPPPALVAVAPGAPVPRLVGHDGFLDLLEQQIVRSRSRTVVLQLTGEPGIGKTAVVEAFAARARAAGAVVVHCRCDALTAALPLQVVLDALALLLVGLDRGAVADALGPDSALLGPLLGVASEHAVAVPGQGDAGLDVADGATGPGRVLGALAGLVERLAGDHPLVILLDDVQVADAATCAWITVLHRRAVPALVLAASRSGGRDLPGTVVFTMGPLQLQAAIELVGADRAEALLARSGGNTLLLLELAAADPADELPRTVVEAVARRTARLGEPAAQALRAAAVLGPELDLDLLATVTGRPPADLLDALEVAAGDGLLEERHATFHFRHELVREALAADTGAARAALWHREAGRALDGRPGADPLHVAHHARLGGDVDLAADALTAAAAAAAARYDHEAAAGLLDQAVALRDGPVRRIARARACTLAGRYADAQADAVAAFAGGAGPEALELGAWAAYFGRQVDDAIALAEDGARLATDATGRARCLAIGGRVHHALGQLAEAEPLLEVAAELAEGPTAAVTAAWLGVLRAHQGRLDDAIALLRPVTHGGGPGETAALLHALLFLGHAHALAGRPAEALRWLDAYRAEVERRQVPRFAGRGENFAAFVLRNLGAHAEADDLNHAARSIGAATPETRVAADLDLAEASLHDGELDEAERLLALAGQAIGPHLVFGWRQELKLRSHRARLELARGDAEEALRHSQRLVADAEALALPRYAAPGRLLEARAWARLGRPADPELVQVDLAIVERAARLEAWWVIAETAVDLGVERWLDRSELLAADLHRAADGRGADGERATGRWLAGRRTEAERTAPRPGP